MSSIPRDNETENEDRSALLTGIKNALLIVAVLYGGIVLAMLLVGNWGRW